MRGAIRDLGVVLGAAWLARVAFVVAIGDAHSLDVDFWRTALAALDQGRNPYETGVLNWPPLWLVVIAAVDAVAGFLGVAFWTALRVYLVLVESALVVTLYVTLLSFGADRAAVRRALLVGIALNPVAIILVCQHGNSDVQVGLLVTLAVAALGAHRRSREIAAWLGGCLFLGLGVLAKTVPLVLAPLLAPGARRASGTERALGAALLLGPAALGTAVILVLAPSAVWDYVITYRSTRGFFGLAGMTVRLATPAHPGDKETIFHAHQKVAHRASDEVEIERGNHNAEAPGLEPLRAWHPLEVLHFSFRSVAQLERKAHGNWLRSPTYEPTAHRLLLDEAYREGRLREHYDEHAVDDEALARGLEEGTLAVDTRLRDALRGLRGDDGAFLSPGAGTTLAFPRPSAADDAAYAAEASVLVEIEGIVRAEQRVRAFERRLELLERGPLRTLARR